MRKPITTSDGQVLYLDPETGKLYKEPEPPEDGLRALTETQSREKGDPRIVVRR